MTRFAPLLAAGLALSLSGCGTISSLTGRSADEGPSEPNPVLQTLVMGTSKMPEIAKKDAERTYSCPSVNVLEGTAAYRIATGGDSQGVSYQASLGQVARECKYDENAGTFSMRVGVEGRVLLGPNGKPGTFTIPLRVAVRKDEKAVYSTQTKISVGVPPNDTQAEFTHIVTDIVLPITARDPGDDYDVLVGFDPGGDKPTKAKPRAKRKAR